MKRVCRQQVLCRVVQEEELARSAVGVVESQCPRLNLLVEVKGKD